jgi:hypothetical protein
MSTPFRKTIITLLPFLFIFGLYSCDVLQQAGRMATFARCEFRLQSVNQLRLAGVQVQNIQSTSELSLLDAAKLTTAIASGSLPLEFILNVEARNPNASQAGMSRMEWILFIDDTEMSRGILEQPVTIPANNGIAVIPMKLNLDLMKVLSGKGKDAILNFGLNLAGAGNKPTRFSMQLKPTIQVASIPVTYPGYITVRTEFSNN